MKKTVAALLLSVAAPVFAVCSYPLDGTQAQMTQNPPTSFGILPTVNGQSIEFTVQPTDSTVFYGAFSSAGLDAMTSAFYSNVPSGDVPLPTSGVAHVRMHIDNFPWQTLSSPGSAIGLIVTILTGNQAAASPLPKNSLQLNAVIVNSTNLSSQATLWVNGQAITGNYVGNINQMNPTSLPLPADIVGFYLNMDTREIGLSVHFTGVNPDPNLPPPGDYDLPPLRDSQGNPLLIPAGVTSVALGLGGYVSRITASEPLVAQNAKIGGTLITDICASTGGNGSLPNGKPFPGKGHAWGLWKK